MRAHARVLPLESLRAARVGTQYHSVSKLEFICAIPTLRLPVTGRPLDAAPRPALPLPPAPALPGTLWTPCGHGRGVRRYAGFNEPRRPGVVISLNPDNRLRPWRAARGGGGGSEPGRVWRLERVEGTQPARAHGPLIAHALSIRRLVPTRNAVTDHTGTPGHTATDVSTLLSPPTPRHTGFDTAYCKTHS